MAGHSKWANIRYRKGAQDAKRGKIFTKFIREITIAARLGGGDVGSNPRLRTVVAKALVQNMTRDIIDRAIKRGVGELEGAQMESLTYEGYGPGGVAVMVECLTDNRNRTVSDVRHAFTKCGGNLGTDGSVAYLFTKVGELSIGATYSEDQIMEVALEAGATDIQPEEDGTFTVTTTPESFLTVVDAMEAAGIKPQRAEITMNASIYVDLDEENAEKLMKMIDMLEDLDDVQEVYSNVDISDEIAAKFA